MAEWVNFFQMRIVFKLNIQFLDDDFILIYLRGCKYSLESTKKKIDMWHTVRTHCPDFFDNWSLKDDKLKELITAG